MKLIFNFYEFFCGHTNFQKASPLLCPCESYICKFLKVRTFIVIVYVSVWLCVCVLTSSKVIVHCTRSICVSVRLLNKFIYQVNVCSNKIKFTYKRVHKYKPTLTVPTGTTTTNKYTHKRKSYFCLLLCYQCSLYGTQLDILIRNKKKGGEKRILDLVFFSCSRIKYCLVLLVSVENYNTCKTAVCVCWYLCKMFFFSFFFS